MARGVTTMTTTYDERGFPSRVVFQDANGNTVTQVVLMRDAGGRAGMANLIKNIWGGPFAVTKYVERDGASRAWAMAGWG